MHRIEAMGYVVMSMRRLPTQLGAQFRLVGGGVVTLYDSGAVVVDGRLDGNDRETLKRRLTQPTR